MRAIITATALALAMAAAQPVLGQTGAPIAGAKPDSIRLQITEQQPYGRYLTDSRGHAVYMFTKDQKGQSLCVESCLQAWPPVTSEAEPTAGTGVEQSKIGTIDQKGKRQVTYDGRPLYYYKQDGETKAATGQGIVSHDGTWYLLAPNGEPIKERRKGETPPPR